MAMNTPEVFEGNPESFERVLAELRAQNRQLQLSREESQQAQTALELSHRFLEIANKHTEKNAFFKDIVSEAQHFSGCQSIGLRILDERGNIPYVEYVGFTESFYEKESPLTIHTDHCMCINVIKGDVDPKMSFISRGGSFYMNGTTRFLATVSEEDKGSTRNVCNKVGYESVALLPVRVGQRIVGLLHLADTRENMVPLTRVEMLERAIQHLGPALQRIVVEEELKKSAQEKELLIKEAHHRIKNNFSIVSSLLGIQSNLISDPAMQTLFKQNQTRVQMMSRLHEAIYQSSSLIDVYMPLYLSHTLEDLEESFGIALSGISLKFDIAEVHLPAKFATCIGLILVELITNAIKYAFPLMKNRSVEVLFESKGDTCFLAVRDNGVGLPPEIDPLNATSMGFELVHMLTRQLNGALSVKRENGTTFSISFPKNQ